MPTTAIDPTELREGITITDLLERTGLSKSRSDARRLIQQGGAYVNEEQVSSIDRLVTTADVQDDAILLRAGKKRYHRITRG